MQSVKFRVTNLQNQYRADKSVESQHLQLQVADESPTAPVTGSMSLRLTGAAVGSIDPAQDVTVQIG